MKWFTLLSYLVISSAMAAVVWDGGTKGVETYKNGMTFKTGKKIDTSATGFDLNGTVTLDGMIEASQTTTPTAPASGSNQLYFKADGKLYTQNANSVESTVAPIAENNLLLNPSFEESYSGNDAKDWTLSNATGTITAGSGIGGGSKYLSLSLSGLLSLSQEITATQYYPNVVSFSLWVKSSITDIQLCSTLATVEQECVSYDGSDQWKKLQVLVTAPSSGAMGLKLKTLSTTSGTVLVDAGEFSSNSLKFVRTREDTGYIWGSGRPNAFNDSKLYTNGSYNTGTRTFTASKKVKVSFYASMVNYASNDNGMTLSLNGTQVASSYTQSQGPTDKSSPQIFWTGVMEAGDTLVNADTGALGGASWTGWSLSATPEDSEKILTANDVVSSETINWQFKSTAIADCGGADAIGKYNTYDYTTNNSNTQSICGTAPTVVTPSNASGLYVRGESATRTTYGCAEPSHYRICIGKGLKGVHLEGYRTANQANEMDILFSQRTSTTITGVQTSYNEKTGLLIIDTGYLWVGTESVRYVGTDFPSSITSETGYIHFAASKNPVISALDAVPRIDYSWENEFSAHVSGSYVVSNENTDFINGNCTQSGGVVTCVPVTNFFTAVPNCVANHDGTTGTQTMVKYDKSNSTTSALKFTYTLSTTGGTTSGSPFTIQCSRGAGDFRSRGDAAAIIAQPTIWVKNTQTDGTSGGSMSSGAWTTNTLNTLEGSNTFGASLSANQITLPKGTYKIEWNAPFVYNFINQSWGVRTQLYSITNSATALYGDFAYAYTSGNDETSINSHGYGTLVLSSAETFELRYYSNRAQATYGLGVNDGITFGLEVYATVKITKVR